MSVLAVIPARYASVRFPGKPLVEINGRPMVEWVYRAAKKVLPDVIVATEDQRIMDAVGRFGGNAMMTPKSCNSGTDRMAYVARKVKADYYVNIQGDEPLMNAAAIKAAVRLALKKKGAATAATTLEKKDFANPNAVKVVLDKESRAIYFSRSLIPFDRDGAGQFKWLKHLGLYVYPRKQLFQFVAWPACKLELTEKLEQLRALYNGMPMYVAETKFDSIGVDTPKDLETVKKFLLPLGRRLG